MEQARISLQQPPQSPRPSGHRDSSKMHDSQEHIVLNVGGTRFVTNKETLMAEPDSFLHGLVSSGVWQPDTETGEYFIDRDPNFFHEILNYLRDGTPDTNTFAHWLSPESPLTETAKHTLASQIDFLQIDSLVAAVAKQHPPRPVPPLRLTAPVLFCGFAKWDYDPMYQTDLEQDRLMNHAAITQTKNARRAASLSEFKSGSIQRQELLDSIHSSGISGPVVFTGGDETIGSVDDALKSGHTRKGFLLPTEHPLQFPLQDDQFISLVGHGQCWCVAIG
eukprot:TRINITY_DN67216_c8_g2_i1.p1 TRINITY_DN67216_c8_g2~~TRINITY_DN67216_c8_g2_i1.p1  ORF type:complete len:324 (-),score=20.63 TRINITY_DN67216_c8_g2_i1:356-1189(-)